MSAAIKWSANPGCFERHLQRKCDNPLFSEKDRAVTANDVSVARDKDVKERKELEAEVKALVEAIAGLGEEPASYDALDGFRLKIEGLREKAAQTGGDVFGIFDALDKIRESLIGDIRAFFTQNNLRDALANLERSERAYHRYVAVYHNPLLAQMHRQDSPITKDDAVASILSEDVSSIRLVCECFNSDTMKEFRLEAADLINAVRKRNETIPQLEEKLQLIFPEGL